MLAMGRAAIEGLDVNDVPNHDHRPKSALLNPALKRPSALDRCREIPASYGSTRMRIWILS